VYSYSGENPYVPTGTITYTGWNDLKRKGCVMDLPIRYRFGKGRELVVVVLVEHWSTSRSVNLHRTAHYVLDLMERDPGCPVVPVALVR